MEAQIRPAFHVPAVWLTGTVDYFELDNEGNLVFTTDGKLVPHHTETKRSYDNTLDSFREFSDDSNFSSPNDSDFA